jgi:hypothetical protein
VRSEQQVQGFGVLRLIAVDALGAAVFELSATARVLPSLQMFRRDPNRSSLLACEDLMKACSVQVPAQRTKTYTAPVEVSVL